MAQPHCPTSEEVARLLENQDLQRHERTIANQKGLKLLPCSIMSPPRIQRELYLAKLTADEAIDIIRSNSENLVSLSCKITEFYSKEPVDGEFPEGEEPDPDDVSEVGEVVGIMRGFTLTQVCYDHLSSQRDPTDLLLFLERTRIPFRRKFCSFLRKIYWDTQKQN